MKPWESSCCFFILLKIIIWSFHSGWTFRLKQTIKLSLFSLFKNFIYSILSWLYLIHEFLGKFILASNFFYNCWRFRLKNFDLASDRFSFHKNYFSFFIFHRNFRNLVLRLIRFLIQFMSNDFIFKLGWFRNFSLLNGRLIFRSHRIYTVLIFLRL